MRVILNNCFIFIGLFPTAILRMTCSPNFPSSSLHYKIQVYPKKWKKPEGINCSVEATQETGPPIPLFTHTPHPAAPLCSVAATRRAAGSPGGAAAPAFLSSPTSFPFPTCSPFPPSSRCRAMPSGRARLPRRRPLPGHARPLFPPPARAGARRAQIRVRSMGPALFQPLGPQRLGPLDSAGTSMTKGTLICLCFQVFNTSQPG